MALAGLTFICGNDDFLVAHRGKEVLQKKFTELGDAVDQETILAHANSVADAERILEQFRQSLQMRSLFGEHKLIWLKDLNLLSDSQTSRAERIKHQFRLLQNALERLDSTVTTVLITAYPIDRRRKEYKWLYQHATSEYLSTDAHSADFAQLLKKTCTELGVTLSSGAEELLIARVSDNTRLILSEVEKLAIYLGNQSAKITEDLVTSQVLEFGEENFFETTDAFYGHDLNNIFSALYRYFTAYTDARPLIVSLQNRNRLTIQLRALLDSGILNCQQSIINKANQAALQQRLNPLFNHHRDKSTYNILTQNPWYLERLASVAKSFTLSKLIKIQRNLRASFSELIARPNSQDIVMRELAVQCFSQK